MAVAPKYPRRGYQDISRPKTPQSSMLLKSKPASLDKSNCDTLSLFEVVVAVHSMSRVIESLNDHGAAVEELDDPVHGLFVK